MLDSILSVIGVLFLSISNVYIWSLLLNKKINFKNYRLYLSVIVLIIFSILNYKTINQMLKFAILTLVMTILIKFIFNVTTKKAIITAFYTQMINVLSELFFSIFAMGILGLEIEVGKYTIFIIFFADIFVSIVSILISKIKFIKKLYLLIEKFANKISQKSLLICLIPIIFLFNVYLAVTYYKFDPLYFIIINNISLFIIFAIIIILMKRENDYEKIYDKYSTTINSLKEYEDILDKYRVSNHENKNQLLTIRSMIVEQDKKTAKYIDGLVKNRLKDDEKIMQEVSVIPAGGLKGLIYSKILYMKEKNIEYELNISKDIRTVDLINNLTDSDMFDICQIIGVYIDNAIEAVIDIKDKYINFDMYLEDKNLIFEISNYYEGKIELDKLEEKGYTTKTDGHGYGLSLTKEIISNNKKLNNEKRLSKETFTQVLKIKIK